MSFAANPNYLPDCLRIMIENQSEIENRLLWEWLSQYPTPITAIIIAIKIRLERYPGSPSG